MEAPIAWPNAYVTPAAASPTRSCRIPDKKRLRPVNRVTPAPIRKSTTELITMLDLDPDVLMMELGLRRGGASLLRTTRSLNGSRLIHFSDSAPSNAAIGKRRLKSAAPNKDSLMPSMQKWIAPFLGVLLLAGTAAVAGADDVALGRQIYFQRCVSCHGLTGEGDGPVAPALSTPPANLRLLSDRFGNPLPE